MLLDLRSDSTWVWADEKTDHLRRELRSLFNRECVDSALNTPDHILADLVVEQLQAYRRTRQATYRHEGRQW
jgi:hypothetical protein